MPANPTDRGTSLLALIRGRDELPGPIGTRIAFDALDSVSADAVAVDERAGRSRLHLGALRVCAYGRVFVLGAGDPSGSAALLNAVSRDQEPS